ncbi:cytochrome c biogenesis protein CcdC [Sutcliffiella horikoshii]|uniref:Cytochrome c biogenesis protein CcdC n=1 Tax=Sutcliffiella horikoshii TaxID=79883 RepID=A0A5D4T7J2_9BACI|nr:cytochrome c biogenesis protein CcdC [Sutcliffiella horikoshii]TYS70462.1 cytochrome c biogenesis protein CcdC [Sutcliffiella horikoshii]
MINLYTVLSTIFAVCMALLVLFIRMKAAKKPSSVKKIVLPPIFMSTGALMFLFPEFRVSSLQILEALTVGAIFSIFLIKTSKFEMKDNDIYLKRSKAFVFILLGLLAVRVVMKLVLSTQIDIGELTGMFWLLAFGMIVPWRIAMYVKYKKIESGSIPPTIKTSV